MDNKELTPTAERPGVEDAAELFKANASAGGNTHINGGHNATAIGPNATAIITGLNGAFVLELLAAKDRQINELLRIIERLTAGGEYKPTNQ